MKVLAGQGPIAVFLPRTATSANEGHSQALPSASERLLSSDRLLPLLPIRWSREFGSAKVFVPQSPGIVGCQHNQEIEFPRRDQVGC